MTQTEIFETVIDVLDRTSIPYMIVGSVASMSYGRPRLTHDMDVVLDMRKEQAEEFVHLFGSDWFVDGEMIRKAIDERFHFNILHLPTGVKVDFFSLKLTSHENKKLNRTRISRKKRDEH
jgi:hypothetical protein